MKMMLFYLYETFQTGFLSSRQMSTIFKTLIPGIVKTVFIQFDRTEPLGYDVLI